MGGEDLKWRQLAHHHNGPTRASFSPHSKAKANYKKAKNLRKNGIYWYKWCCGHFSILQENPSEEVLDYDNYYYEEKKQEMTVFHGRLKLTFAYETKARKWW